jgi:hypothetical protein
VTPSRSPEWLALSAELVALSGATHAHNAYVADATGMSWCAAHDFSEQLPQSVADLLAWRLDQLPKPLPKGGVLDAAVSRVTGTPGGHAYFASFAGVYVLVLRFAGPFDVDNVRTLVGTALPRLEALTLALPPPEGPDHDAHQAFRKR